MLTLLHNMIAWAWIGIPAFLFVVTFIVFFHELGHFLVARAFGVAVETFSIGFGNEIFGWTDNKGTRWRVSWLPLGGYVKFAGDEGPTSIPDHEKIAKMSAAERSRALPLKPLYQRALVAAAGPVANFILAIVVLTGLYGIFGIKMLSTEVGSVIAHSPAEAGGIRPGDKIVAVNGRHVRFFYGELQGLIGNSNGKRTELTILRGGKSLELPVTPRLTQGKNFFGVPVEAVEIGVGPGDDTSDNSLYIHIPAYEAPLAAAEQCWGIVDNTFTYLGLLITRQADASQLSGPVGIAKAAKTAADNGPYELISLIAFISVSIGLVNLFPIPLLDGGHLLYYACEAVLGRPLDERTQDVGFRLGLALVLGLLIFTTWNNLVR
jgi:regulator of sigma E protease